ncbi:MAG: hypothetical protein A2521_13315 [Deltaproteobacteria bacterium RIFOXYD12_FULL_57_12]|nr:MAG: hypothetical protein A2521_13315 [Deltaproteobacteria bacterium RIFOXYD12_FULL_57_12]
MRKFPFIDALRGLAILGVVYVHAGLWGEPASSWLIRFAVNGRRGVQLFFVVSALTLFLSMDNRRKREKNPIRNFFIRRFFRIAPLFYCGIIAYTLIDGFSPRYGAPDGIEWWYLPLTALFINGWSPETITSVVPGGWAIAVEMTFYLVFPLLYRRLHSIGATLCFVGAALVFDFVLSSALLPLLSQQYPAGQQTLVDDFFYLWFFAQLPTFGMGVLAYHIFRRQQVCVDSRKGLVLIFFSLYLFVLLLKLNPYENIFYAGVFAVFSLALHQYPAILFVNPLTQWLGRLSFSIYITHFAILKLLHAIFVDGFVFQGDFGSLAAFLLVLLLSVGVSVLTYRFIEQPGISLGHRLIEKLERYSPAAS